jgi:hypothetical protein
MTHYIFSVIFDCHLKRLSKFYLSDSESDLLYDWGFNAHQFVLATSPLRLATSNFFQLNTCGHIPYVTSSLTRRLVCRLILLLAFASAVILRSESRGTHDHILLSLIRDSRNLEGQVPVFISSRNRLAQLYLQELGSLFRRLLCIYQLPEILVI